MISKRTVGGFSLLEMMIAFVGIAMLLGVLIQLFGNGLDTVRVGERYTRATVIAQSHLAAAGLEHPIEEGVTSGVAEDAFHWKMTVTPYRDAHLSAAQFTVRPLTVQVEVFWEEGGESRMVSLTSIRLRPLRS